MNYKEALEYIHSVCWLGSRPGLERIRVLADKLRNPQDKLRFIHVTGTNGKGSVCTMLSSILRSAGYKTGLFTSPYISFFNERMCINGEPISNVELAEITEYIRPSADSMADQPTEFELITAIALEYFSRNNCDIVVFEVGMGGRLDSTNIIENTVVSVITGVALDHMAYLGDTVEKIAAEKAGIIKEGRPVVYGGNDKAAGAVIAEKAESCGSELCVTDISKLENVVCTLKGCSFDYGRYKNVNVSLTGTYQPQNASIVLDVTDMLNRYGLNVPESAIRYGLANAVWHARFEILSENPTVIYDGAHNPQAIRAFVDGIKYFFGNRKVNILTGVMKDKDYYNIVSVLGEIAADAFTVTPDNPRALDSNDYAEIFRKYSIKAHSYDKVEKGVRAAYEATLKNNIPLIVAGSFYMYAEFREAFDKIKIE